jgi:hypothetical protein
MLMLYPPFGVAAEYSCTRSGCLVSKRASRLIDSIVFFVYVHRGLNDLKCLQARSMKLILVRAHWPRIVSDSGSSFPAVSCVQISGKAFDDLFQKLIDRMKSAGKLAGKLWQ